jgi:hypothetical protein
MLDSPCLRPPRLAAWLVELFTSADQAECILGDLAEEFSDLASRSGVVSARRWYWRQSAKTIAHLAGAGFRVAPWSLAGVVLLGFLLERFSFALPERVIVAILRTQRPYSNLHYHFYVWLVTYGISIARVLQTVLIGCIVATFAKGREIVATTTLCIASRPLSVLLFFLLTGGHWPKFILPWPFLIIQVENLIGLVIGGGSVHEFRSVVARRFSRT